MVTDFKITISGFTTSGGREDAAWLLRSGTVSVVCGYQESARRSLLDSLAGRKKNSGLTVEVETRGVRRIVQALPSPAVLPAPGEEVFVGTTVGEQLDFYGRGSARCGKLLLALDERFGFGFRAIPRRSVWELGAGEQRCLLLVSQALAGPESWIMHSPLERLDGPRQRSMLDFIGECEARDSLVVASTAHPNSLLGTENSSLLVLGDTVREILYQGQGEAAGNYLAAQWQPAITPDSV